MATETKQRNSSKKTSSSRSNKRATTSSNKNQKNDQKKTVSIRVRACMGGNGDDPNRRNNINRNNRTCGNELTDSESEEDESTKSQDERDRSNAARQINENRPVQERAPECLVNLFNILTNPNRDERAGGTYEVLQGYACCNGGTNEINHIPASNCLVGTNLDILCRQEQLAIIMFKRHHRTYPSTGRGGVDFRSFQRDIINNEGFDRALEFEILNFFLQGLFLQYALGWHDLLLRAYRDLLITRLEAIDLVVVLIRLWKLIADRLDRGYDFDNVDPRVFTELNVEFDMDMQFTDLDIERNLQKLLETYIDVNGTDAGFYDFLRKFIDDIRTVLQELLDKLNNKTD